MTGYIPAILGFALGYDVKKLILIPDNPCSKIENIKNPKKTDANIKQDPTERIPYLAILFLNPKVVSDSIFLISRLLF